MGLVWFIKFTIKFMRPESLSPKVDEYLREEERIIELLSEDKI